MASTPELCLFRYTGTRFVTTEQTAESVPQDCWGICSGIKSFRNQRDAEKDNGAVTKDTMQTRYRWLHTPGIRATLRGA
jgi:hypothetical protein